MPSASSLLTSTLSCGWQKSAPKILQEYKKMACGTPQAIFLYYA